MDEALKQIDRLKKDMNHLCTDLDSLFKSKKDITNQLINDTYQSSESRSSSFSNLNFEFDDDLVEDFSSLNENCRFKTPFRELNLPKSMHFFFNDKSTQTSRIRCKALTIKSIKRISNRSLKKNRRVLTYY